VTELRVALCQIDTVVGDIDGNVGRVLDALAEAELVGADLAVFPELALTGYPPEDLLVEPAFVAANLRGLERVCESTDRCAAIVGYVEEDVDLYNAAAVCAGGKLHGSWRKVLLPNYGVFDEARYFSPGAGGGPLYVIGGARVGVTICEDGWSPSGPISQLAAAGAELVVSCNASPYRKGIATMREAMFSTRAADASCPIAYVNLVGGQDELVFDGGSMVIAADGALVASASQFAECVTVCDVDLHPVFRKRLLDPRGRADRSRAPLAVVSEQRGEPRPPLPPPQITPRLEPAEEVYAALTTATHDYVVKNRFQGVLVGLSGGVDSSLVATIAVDALGAAAVRGVLMPSRYSSEGSVADAQALAANLGIDTLTIPIEGPHAAFLELLEPVFAGRQPDLTEENVQSRVRGVILMSLSNKFGSLVLTTGNKSEVAVGYATLYGDMAGGFAVIRDVPKTLVYELCEMRNARAARPLIPEAVLTKPPSAELRPDQRDDQSLPPYEVLDPILEGYVEQDRSVPELVAAGFDEATVRRVIRLVDRAEYKRRQGPPGPRITSRGFGKDRRMPITNGFAAEASQSGGR
jgi:NAD+ synthase (glutamine-hydrolysing)